MVYGACFVRHGRRDVVSGDGDAPGGRPPQVRILSDPTLFKQKYANAWRINAAEPLQVATGAVWAPAINCYPGVG